MSGDATIANTGAVTIAANAVEIGMIGCEQTTISDSDSHIPTSGAVVDYVTSRLAPIGGLEVIADDESFEEVADMPPAGVVVSITDAAGLSVNSSGVSTNGDTKTTNAQVTINGFPSELRGGVGSNADPYVFQSGAGLMVVSTGSSNTYNYHQALIRESDFVQLSDDINDFNNRYRIHNGEPSSNNDDGDLVWDTNANKMKVYNSTSSAWEEVTSIGDYKLLGIKDNGQAHNGTGPTFNGSNDQYDLFDGTSDAVITSAGQLLVVLNGVLQKPNAAYDAAGEGFALDGTDGIRFCDPPPSGSTLFVTQIGTGTTVNVPADNSVSEGKIQSGAVSLAKMASESVDEDNLYISNAGSNGQFLQKQSGNNGGLTWATVSTTSDKIIDGTSQFEVHAGSGNTSDGYADLKLHDATGNDGQPSVKFERAKTTFNHGNLETSYELALIANGGTAKITWDDDAGSNNMGTLSYSGAATTPQFHFSDANDNLDIYVGTFGVNIFGDSDKGADTSAGNYGLHIGGNWDFEVYHDGTDTFLDNDTGNLYIRNNVAADVGGDIYIKPHDNEDGIKIVHDGGVELYHNNIKTLETTGQGIKVLAGEGDACNLELFADEGDDNADKWRMQAHAGGSYILQNYTSGAWENSFVATGNGAIELNYDNTTEFQTKSGGIKLLGHSEQIVTALTSAASLTIDFSLSNHFSCTMGHNITFNNPTTESVGQSGTITLTQDGTGSRTAAWGTQFLWAGGTAPTLTTTANAVDRIDYVVVAADKIHCVATLALD